MEKLKNYNGSVQLMAGITQKGGGEFALIEASAVQVDEEGGRLDAKLADLENKIDSGGGGVSNIADLTPAPWDTMIVFDGGDADVQLAVLDETILL